MEELDARVRAHCERFNAAQRGNEWAPFVETFAEDAHMAFTNLPIGPFEGRAAILAAYEIAPPDDTMEIVGIEAVAERTARARFRWSTGAPGTMFIRFNADGLVADLQITFG